MLVLAATADVATTAKVACRSVARTSLKGEAERRAAGAVMDDMSCSFLAPLRCPWNWPLEARSGPGRTAVNRYVEETVTRCLERLTISG